MLKGADDRPLEYHSMSHLCMMLIDTSSPHTVAPHQSMQNWPCLMCVQAVTYFRRALKLNYQYLSAWTLMGHEYVEMKSPPAAIGAYLYR